ncbi:glycerate kinase [Hypomontagnella monticulosa]|nr:glycerate kinase [Hypomontagnella monticulosa]
MDPPTSRKLRFLVVSGGFKEIPAKQAANHIEEGIRRVFPDESALIYKLPVHDAGPGFCQAVVAARNGQLRKATVFRHGVVFPFHYGLIDNGKTSVFDVEATIGFKFVPFHEIRLEELTSYGIGRRIVHALDSGCTKIVIGCGDVARCDGGAGMLQALGAKLLDVNGEEIPIARGAKSLSLLGSIDMSNVHYRLRQPGKIQIEAVSCLVNPFYFSQGFKPIFGSLKTTLEQPESHALILDRFAMVVGKMLKDDVRGKAGSGVSGGLGLGLMMLRAQFRTTEEAADEYFGLSSLFDEPWDLVIVGEGCVNTLFSRGTIAMEVARHAQERAIPAVVVADTIWDKPADLYGRGVTSFTSIFDGSTSMNNSTDRLLKDAVERSMRMIRIGISVSGEQIESQTHQG